MSKLIRHLTKAPTVFIGERHEATLLEAKAEKTLGAFFPGTSFVTAPDGAKLIPIGEVLNLKAILDDQCTKAHSRGYAEGHAAGLDEGLRDARRVVGEFEQAIRDTVEQRESILLDAKQNVLKLVIGVARKVTFDAVNIDREATATMIERVIDQLTDKSKLLIRVHPDFLPVVEQESDRLLSGSTAIKELRFQADSRVRGGGCFIETPTGDIDARLESQLEVIEAVLSDEGEV